MSRRNYFSLHRLSGRIFFSFMLIALLTLITSLVAGYLLSQTDSNHDAVNRRLDEYNQAVLFNSLAGNMNNVISEIVYNDRQDARSFYLDYYVQANGSLSRLSKLVLEDPDPASNAEVEDLKKKFDVLAQNYQQILNTDNNRFSQQQLYSQSSDQRNVFISAAAQMIESRRTLLSNSENDDATFIAQARLVGLGLSVVTLILEIGLAFWITRRFARPTNELIAKLRLVSEGDLTEPLVVQGQDEISDLSFVINRTVNSLKSTLARIKSQAVIITSTSQHISRSSVSQATNLAQQAVAVSQVSATVEELAGTSHQIADSANRAADSSTQALTSAERGYETILATDQTMSEIKNKVNQIADRILNLNAIAQRIREITKLIDNIANETHLLALNAAIESAGAGEEGQRFGVVASNVRRLAQRSRVATVEIQQLVNQIQNAAGASVMATEEGMKIVTIGEEMLNESLQATQAIIEQVMQTNEMATAISLATDQQRLASAQVASSISEFSRIIKEVSEGSQQNRVGVMELTEVVIELNNLTDAFLVEKPAKQHAVNLKKLADNGRKEAHTNLKATSNTDKAQSEATLIKR